MRFLRNVGRAMCCITDYRRGADAAAAATAGVARVARPRSPKIGHILGCQNAAKLAEAIVPVSGRVGALEIFHREIGSRASFCRSSLTMTCGACAGSRRL